MNAELTDADLWQAHRDADLMDVLGQNKSAELYRRVLAALRARRAQDTPSDPAAWVYRDSWGHIRATDDPEQVRTLADMGVDMEPVVRLRAPGAVAAAPTEDEDDPTRAVLDLAYRAQDVHELSAGADVVYRYIAAGWRLVPPAPSAGEDEAAVARAAQAMHAAYVAGYHNTDAPGRHAEWSDLTRKQRNGWLAAARGPRTQDDT